MLKSDDDARPESARPDQGEEAEEKREWMPSPAAFAVAVLAMLGFGVMLGSATSQLAQSAGVRSILLEASPSKLPPPHEEAVAEAPRAAPVEASAAPTAIPAEVPALPEAAPAPEEAAPEEAPPELPPELPEPETLPPVKHVFLIVLGANGFEEAFGPSSPAPYLAKTLPEKGELLTNYYAVAASDLANQIALLSGQGPTPETNVNCPSLTDVLPGTLAAEGQVLGSGCAYPVATPTLPGQLAEKKLVWKAYVEAPLSACAPAPEQRNPFLYFHAFTDQPECGGDAVGLEQLPLDLGNAKKTPALSYIVPNTCHSGGEIPCAEGAPTGPVAAEEFLRKAVPAIEASPAYKEGGLIAITSALAPQSGPHPDPSSCCIAPKYPNLPAPAGPEETVTGPVKPAGGGGRVGLLLLSPFVAPGSRNETGYFNHYSLLRSIEELFELEPLGYAAEIALAGFDSTVYNAEETAAPAQPDGSSSSASCRDCASRIPSADHSSPSSSKKPWRATPVRKAIR